MFETSSSLIGKESRLTNDKIMTGRAAAFWLCNADRSCVDRWTAAAICRRLIVTLLFGICCCALAQGQSANMSGRWNVEINFADGNKRSLRLDAQPDGKATFLVTDPMLSRWGPGKPSEAKWAAGDQNSVTFSGAVEFPLGNVGRDAGTLNFKGKLETTDLIVGQVEFAPLVGDRPSKHGTFKATRNNSPR